MIIQSVRVKNYKSFLDSQEIEFGQGFNVIIGQNNAGKTALIEALSLNFKGGTHRSPDNNNNDQQVRGSSTEITISLSPDEFLQRVLGRLPDGFSIAQVPKLQDHQSAERFTNVIVNGATFRFIFSKNGEIAEAELLGYGSLIGNSGLYMRYNSENGIFEHGGSSNNPFHVPFSNMLKASIYLFNAERPTKSEAQIEPKIVLQSDASNLAQVLLNLSSDKEKEKQFDELCSLMNRVFPDIRRVYALPVANSTAKIKILTIDSSLPTTELAMDLSACGTGIGQVLGMLYVVVNSKTPRIIVIDEPQSFLHPGAIRKLFEIFKEYSHHQYILTTHSPAAISAADIKRIITVSKEGFESRVVSVGVEETEKLTLFLSELGTRLSDVFGADNILWVEGPTEQECFPIIVSEIIKKPLLGTEILGVKRTGDLEGRFAKTVFEIYERLCEGKGILPPAIGFIFDREGRSETTQEDLKRHSKGLVSFLKRRMYENYLLNPEAIAYVLSEEIGSSVDVEAINAWLDENRWSADFKVERSEQAWYENVHGGNLLAEIFRHFSDSKHKYAKVEHGVALTRWIIENATQDLDEVVEIIKQHLPSS